MSKVCNGCGTSDNTPIPYAAFEDNEMRHEKREKRLVISLIIAIIMIFASNAMWIYCWTQYDYTSEETIYQQDGQGTNIIGEKNEVNYGAENDIPPQNAN